MRINRLDEFTLGQIAERADQLGVSSEELVRAMILERFGRKGAERAKRAEAIRAMTPYRLDEDSKDIIRRLRHAG